MATRILHRTQLFEGIWKRTTQGTFLWNFIKIQSIVSEEKFFEGRVYGCTHGQTNGQMHNRHNAMTIACWPLASGAKNIKHIIQLVIKQGSCLTHKPGFWRIKILKFPVLTLKKNRSCVILTRQKFRVVRRNSTRLIKNRYIYTAHEMSTCVNTGLLFRLALSYDIVYLQSISGN